MKGILFKPEMVRAIKEGRKTQTRRLMKPQPCNPTVYGVSPIWGSGIHSDGRFKIHASFNHLGGRVDRYLAAKYSPGETVYVKEEWCNVFVGNHPNGLRYRADNEHRCRWKNALFMPESASRLKLRIRDVTAQRLQKISSSDVIDEGLDEPEFWYEAENSTGRFLRDDEPIEAYSEIWDSINPKHPWSENPFVWKYTFEKL